MRKSNYDLGRGFAALSVALAAVWVTLAAIDAVNWSDEEVVLVTGVSTAAAGLVLSVIAHYRKNTTPEPVAFTTAIYATTNALILMLVGFQYVHWTPDQIGVVLVSVNALLMVPGAFINRRVVEPVTTKAEAMAPAAHGENLRKP
jgi:uncharacterized membrane protein YfcA